MQVTVPPDQTEDKLDGFSNLLFIIFLHTNREIWKQVMFKRVQFPYMYDHTFNVNRKHLATVVLTIRKIEVLAVSLLLK